MVGWRVSGCQLVFPVEVQLDAAPTIPSFVAEGDADGDDIENSLDPCPLIANEIDDL